MNTFYHTGKIGDIIYSLPLVEKMGGGDYVTGLPVHIHNQLKPLLLEQPYIEQVKHISETVLPIGFINLDNFRHNPRFLKTHLVNTYLDNWGFKPYDFTKPWMKTGHKWSTYLKNPYSIVNRALRYHDKIFEKSGGWKREIAWLKKKTDTIYFIGTEVEWMMFDEIAPGTQYLACEDFKMVKDLLSGAYHFSGSQSAPLAIRQALGLPYRFEQSPNHIDCNTYTENETVLNPTTRKIHKVLSAIKDVL